MGMTQLTFNEELRYPDDPSGITIPMLISYGGKTLRASPKADCGAEVCLFSREIGEGLGLQIEQGIPTTLNMLNSSLEVFGHEVVIQTGTLIFQSVIYFAKYPGLPRNILGREGWLRKIRFAVIDYDNLLYLSPYDSL
jgi:hypothetical protein